MQDDGDDEESMFSFLKVRWQGSFTYGATLPYNWASRDKNQWEYCIQQIESKNLCPDHHE